MILEARNIYKHYENGTRRLEVLRDVSLSVSQGEIAAIVGPSGAGKSTLLHILGGLDRPARGNIFFEGRPLGEASDAQLSSLRNEHIGFVFQFYHLMPEFSVLENVLMPAIIRGKRETADARQRAMELLSSIGLEKRLNHLPSQLSGGEKQRVAVARALINRPKLLLCDEPTGNLDSENGAQICNLLKKLNREKEMAIVMVTHNLDVAALASKRYNMFDGKLNH
ncbi:ABC transporter ATP-binding protein [bacterium]|nr:MAG: ABC transporter ATP-binding protein [bacterium]